MLCSLLVVGAAVLTLVTTEYPAVKVNLGRGLLLDGVARYAARSINYHQLNDSTIGTCIHTSATLATAAGNRSVVFIHLGIND